MQKEREKGKERGPAKREKMPLSLEKPKIMFSSFFLINCSVDMQD